jgi:hypothetical protein
MGPTSRTEEVLWARLGRWRDAPLSVEELEQACGSPGLSAELWAALIERLALQGAAGLPALLRLVETHGPRVPLLRALGMIHRPEARALLFGWIGDDGVDQATLLRSLAFWAREVDLEVLRRALRSPGRDLRLAGLHLLVFQQRRHETALLLDLVREPLGDLRAEVVIETLRVLQRRDDPAIVAAIAAMASDDALPGVGEAALQALGCIGTLESVEALLERAAVLGSPALRGSLERQIRSQFRHRGAMAERIRERTAQGLIGPDQAARLLELLGR